MHKPGFILFSLLCLAPSVSSGNELEGYYLGGGLSSNSLTGFSNAVGHQVFGGYDFGQVLGEANVMAEAGYWNSGRFSRSGQPGRPQAKGLWGTAVISLPLTGQWSLLGRAGLDFGDDDGLMVGLGGAWRLDRQWELRGEIVARDNTDSFQFNALYRF
ncbi:outer membrane beta-barrel protein [Natronospira bacteriovora]|uniref:Outer membrane beta-barrel protein n=1 Tax=Natronospira bacteriovora TaxID=3069753 RepID=A0ABU0W8R3_9GAMM|nr:outer membrane beta-barrel protein [Natronospira sp. AB-CW4]MDQ2070298.1 outer membrane beta-barrel protein [Natronospira sp. AB-CW4]